MTKKRKNHKEELRKARSTGRNAVNRLKAYKEGVNDGLKLAREARRD